MTNKDDLSKNLEDKHLSVLLKKLDDYVEHDLNARDGWLTIKEPSRKKIFRRPGSPKSRGWQVTIRGSFHSHVRDKNGTSFLLFPRGRGYLVPLRDINNFLLKCADDALDKDTVDIFFAVDEKGKTVIRYHEGDMDISDFSLPI